MHSIKKTEPKAIATKSIPTKLLKVFDKTTSVSFAKLINLSFEKGIFAKCFKITSAINNDLLKR